MYLASRPVFDSKMIRFCTRDSSEFGLIMNALIPAPCVAGVAVLLINPRLQIVRLAIIARLLREWRNRFSGDIIGSGSPGDFAGFIECIEF